jgi:hypothetical protein
MPRGDGTGPGGQGPKTGRGLGAGGQRLGNSGQGRRGKFAAGPGGFCICPSCGEKKTHQLGIPCFEQKCPKCGTVMTRE